MNQKSKYFLIFLIEKVSKRAKNCAIFWICSFIVVNYLKNGATNNQEGMLMNTRMKNGFDYLVTGKDAEKNMENPREIELLNWYRKLTPEKQDAIRQMAKLLAE